MVNHWEPGSPVLLRSVRDGAVRGARSATVVADSDALIALYIAPGYPRKIRAGVRGGPRNRVMLAESGEFADSPWIHHRVLILYRPGDAHSCQLFWDWEAASPTRWYIDLHEPLRRTPLGFDTRDHVLDVRMAIDRASWEWKDEDELAWHLEDKQLPLPPVEALRAEGLLAIARLQATDPVLYREWEAWQPDLAWPVPVISEGWRQVL